MELKTIFSLYGQEIQQTHLLLQKHWKREIKNHKQLDQFFKMTAQKLGIKGDYKIFAYAVLTFSKSIETIAIYPNFKQYFR